ncbi:uncharacterized protein LOC128270773 [Anopheles cruzii]|uniref:uncharacterized protein LOC128270773 n=1 Tax=Anopheles cruzii TaxID=68878 RepID=UPI0022EC7E73|nr:uncharacterized protein LOC128270773 [Anopheles cruzii]
MRKHHCKLPGAMRADESETHLPPILPGTTLCSRLLRYLRSSLLVSPNHPETRIYYQSRTKISAENERLVHQLSPFVIHPFSQFRMCWGMLIFFVLILHLVTLGFAFCFAPHLPHRYLWLLQIFDTLLCLMLAVEFLLQLFTGYESEGVIVLDPTRIVRYRLRWWNLTNSTLLLVPYVLLLDKLVVAFYQDAVLMYLGTVVYLYLLCVWRFTTINRYFETIAKGLLRLSLRQIHFVKAILNTLYVLHWTACLLYIVPMLSLSLLNEDRPEANFLVDVLWTQDQQRDAEHYPIRHRARLVVVDFHAHFRKNLAEQPPDDVTNSVAFLGGKLDDVHYNVTVPYRYLRALMITLKISLQGGHSLSVGAHFLHDWLQSLLLLCGWLWSTYILLLLVRSIMVADASTTRYDEILNEIDAFCTKKLLSRTLRQKLRHHFECHYRMHYFDERPILAHTSDYLRREMLLDVAHSAFLRRVDLFRDLPQYLLEDIADGLRFELFLAQDPITTADSKASAMYFLASGTAAVYTPDGEELGHLVDGANFGAVTLFRKDAKRTVSVVALEVCEVYWLEGNDFRRLMKPHPSLWAYITKLAEKHMVGDQPENGEDRFFNTFLY